MCTVNYIINWSFQGIAHVMFNVKFRLDYVSTLETTVSLKLKKALSHDCCWMILRTTDRVIDW